MINLSCSPRKWWNKYQCGPGARKCRATLSPPFISLLFYLFFCYYVRWIVSAVHRSSGLLICDQVFEISNINFIHGKLPTTNCDQIMRSATADLYTEGWSNSLLQFCIEILVQLCCLYVHISWLFEISLSIRALSIHIDSYFQPWSMLSSITILCFKLNPTE